MLRSLPAVAASAAIVLAGPLIGQIRSTFLARFPSSYRTILLTVVGTTVAVALTLAILRIRERRRLRYGLLATALAIGVSYSWWSRTGNLSVDAVERFHFIEYGLITFLYYRAARSINDGSLVFVPVLAGVLVGICEEWLQWFVPARVGEIRDVFLNLWAILCGLLFSIAVDPPLHLSLALNPDSKRRIRRLATIVVFVFACFFDAVHLGFRIEDGQVAFSSAFSPAELVELSRERRERWQTSPPRTWQRYSREDQYFSEGVAFVQARNRCWDAGNVTCAWTNNLIAERYYLPVLETPSFVSESGLRWPPQQRDDAERRAQSGVASAANDPESVIYPWNAHGRALFWIAVGVLILELLRPLLLIRRHS